jgi:predicted permease
MRDGWQDLKIAARRLRYAPGFALTAVVTLAVAIAASLVVFGLLNTAVQRQLAIAGADRVWQVVQKPEGYISESYPDYIDYRTRNTTFSDMAAEWISEAAMSTGGHAERAWDYEVSGNYFDVLGVQPEAGRFFHGADEHGPNSAPYVVLSDGYWRSRFGADPRVVGTTVDVNKHSFTILGVAPESFHGTELFMWPDFWVPMVNERQIGDGDYLDNRYTHGLFVFGRLRPGITPQQAAENLNAIAAQLAKQYPQTDDQLGARLVRPGMFGDELGDSTRGFLAGMLLLAMLVLVAACLNLAGIFAARAVDRARELAVRIAIGSSRWRLLRQMLAEAVLLAVAGARRALSRRCGF